MTQEELSLDNPNGWHCPNCSADSGSLVYTEDVSVFFNNIRVEDDMVYVSSPANDYSCPTGQRLWCSECDTYLAGEQAEDEGTADPKLEVHYE